MKLNIMGKIQSEIRKLNTNLGDYCAFIDTSKKIKTINSYNQSWVATENCWCSGQMKTSGNVAAWITLDNEWIELNAATVNKGFCFPVKKGQTVATRNDSSGTYDLRFFKQTN